MKWTMSGHLKWFWFHKASQCSLTLHLQTELKLKSSLFILPSSSPFPFHFEVLWRSWMTRQRYTFPASLVMAQELITLSLSFPTPSFAFKPLASHSVTSIPKECPYREDGLCCQHLYILGLFFLPSMRKVPVGKWYSGFAVSFQMCLLKTEAGTCACGTCWNLWLVV